MPTSYISHSESSLATLETSTSSKYLPPVHLLVQVVLSRPLGALTRTVSFWQHLWFALASRQGIKPPLTLSQWRPGYTSGQTLQWRFMPALWLTVCPGPQCLGFCSGGCLSPTNKLDAGSASSTGAPFLPFACVNVHWIDISCFGVDNHTYMPTMVEVSRLLRRTGKSPLLTLLLILTVFCG